MAALPDAAHLNAVPGGNEPHRGPRANKPATSPADGPVKEGPLPEGLLVVGDRAGARRFLSLSEACAAAKSGDLIELRYDGPREERPFTLHNKRIEIRAGAAAGRPSFFVRVIPIPSRRTEPCGRSPAGF